eukprot:gene17161-biopygen8063
MGRLQIPNNPHADSHAEGDHPSLPFSGARSAEKKQNRNRKMVDGSTGSSTGRRRKADDIDDADGDRDDARQDDKVDGGDDDAEWPHDEDDADDDDDDDGDDDDADDDDNDNGDDDDADENDEDDDGEDDEEHDDGHDSRAIPRRRQVDCCGGRRAGSIRRARRLRGGEGRGDGRQGTSRGAPRYPWGTAQQRARVVAAPPPLRPAARPRLRTVAAPHGIHGAARSGASHVLTAQLNQQSASTESRCIHCPGRNGSWSREATMQSSGRNGKREEMNRWADMNHFPGRSHPFFRKRFLAARGVMGDRRGAVFAPRLR